MDHAAPLRASEREAFHDELAPRNMAPLWRRHELRLLLPAEAAPAA